MSEPSFNGPLAHLLRNVARHSPPDPWPAEIEAAVRSQDAVPLCPDCLHPQAPRQEFCPHCNFPTGDYVPFQPFPQTLWIGEFLRRGVTGPGRNSFFQNLGFVIFSASQYAVFAPIYWYWLVSKALDEPLVKGQRQPLEFDDAPAVPTDAGDSG
jgi:hypothetical protein